MIKKRTSTGRVTVGLAVLALAFAGCGGGTPASTSWPVTSLHYTPNSNFGSSGQYVPRADGFNLADVSIYQKSKLDHLPADVRGLVWIGQCDGATPAFRTAVDAFAGDPKLFGFYVMDEPNPSTCPAAHLLAEDNWIHAHVPGAQTFVILENLGSELSPTFDGSYTPQDSGLDLVGLDPYPVRTELHSPDYAEISQYVTAAEAQGWPLSSLVPVYQAFGGGNYPDDAKGYWKLPSPAEERQMLADWAALIQNPKFDYVYSWGSQEGDTSLNASPALQSVFTAKNK